jgi:hypothetical protein
MKPKNASRRKFFQLAALGAAAPALMMTSIPTEAYQGNMERALSALDSALASLQNATPNKGGHRERAINLIERAIGEVKAGIEFADERDGGGY